MKIFFSKSSPREKEVEKLLAQQEEARNPQKRCKNQFFFFAAIHISLPFHIRWVERMNMCAYWPKLTVVEPTHGFSGLFADFRSPAHSTGVLSLSSPLWRGLNGAKSLELIPRVEVSSESLHFMTKCQRKSVHRRRLGSLPARKFPFRAWPAIPRLLILNYLQSPP